MWRQSTVWSFVCANAEDSSVSVWQMQWHRLVQEVRLAAAIAMTQRASRQRCEWWRFFDDAGGRYGAVNGGFWNTADGYSGAAAVTIPHVFDTVL